MSSQTLWKNYALAYFQKAYIMDKIYFKRIYMKREQNVMFSEFFLKLCYSLNS